MRIYEDILRLSKYITELILYCISILVEYKTCRGSHGMIQFSINLTSFKMLEKRNLPRYEKFLLSSCSNSQLLINEVKENIQSDRTSRIRFCILLPWATSAIFFCKCMVFIWQKGCRYITDPKEKEEKRCESKYQVVSVILHAVNGFPSEWSAVFLHFLSFMV